MSALLTAVFSYHKLMNLDRNGRIARYRKYRLMSVIIPYLAEACQPLFLTHATILSGKAQNPIFPHKLYQMCQEVSS